ncbi:DUF433 domain-containing protein [Pseudanabaena sp. UWO311]|uniref:DUF433 domain-containing protein n=1 Tax=Pseudanabaena sp. UWO311 TaxID=2487337 RepID=UPI001CC1CD3F|nr:DUF433 domain-containing protein [Pseudanabaena sp. UWO311]
MTVLKFLDEKVYMRSLVTEIINGESYSYYPLGQYVVRAMGVCGDRPTFKYTRIEIAGVMERLAKGENVENIVLGFRGRVSREAIAEAIQVVTTHFLESLPILSAA